MSPVMCYTILKFLSTPSARRATCQATNRRLVPTAISIHALREEGDLDFPSPVDNAPLFLSTPSARRATKKGSEQQAGGRNFYPRPPRGGRPELKDQMDDLDDISIHALREEGDLLTVPPTSIKEIFLSTPSARRATTSISSKLIFASISIHALREEGDQPAGAMMRIQ